MDIKKFTNEIFGDLNMYLLTNKVTGEKEPWFLLNEICEKLQYSNPTMAMKRHVWEEDRKTFVYEASNETLKAIFWTKSNDFSNKTLISEPGLYSLIFGSRLPAAHEFKKWVCEAVLPSIRKNGGYINGQENLTAEEQEEIINPQVRLLSEKVKDLEERKKYLNKRRHELLAQARISKEKIQYLNAEEKKLNEALDMYENWVAKLVSENEDLYYKIYPKTAPAKKKVSTTTTVVDRNGMVVSLKFGTEEE